MDHIDEPTHPNVPSPSFPKNSNSRILEQPWNRGRPSLPFSRGTLADGDPADRAIVAILYLMDSGSASLYDRRSYPGEVEWMRKSERRGCETERKFMIPKRSVQYLQWQSWRISNVLEQYMSQTYGETDVFRISRYSRPVFTIRRRPCRLAPVLGFFDAWLRGK